MLLLEPGQRVPDAGVEWGRWAEGLIRAKLLSETDKAVEEEAASARTPPKTPLDHHFLSADRGQDAILFV